MAKISNDDFLDPVIVEIKKRAKLYIEDNLRDPTDRDRLLIENAMLIGASIATEFDLDLSRRYPLQA